VASGAAAGAIPQLRGALAGAINDILPAAKTALAGALSDGVSKITKENQTVFIGFGVAIGFFTIGSLMLMYAQYRRLGKCCPTR
jgi:hypothetical protein